MHLLMVYFADNNLKINVMKELDTFGVLALNEAELIEIEGGGSGSENGARIAGRATGIGLSLAIGGPVGMCAYMIYGLL